jgi:hypothetical protein
LLRTRRDDHVCRIDASATTCETLCDPATDAGVAFRPAVLQCFHLGRGVAERSREGCARQELVRGETAGETDHAGGSGRRSVKLGDPAIHQIECFTRDASIRAASALAERVAAVGR